MKPSVIMVSGVYILLSKASKISCFPITDILISLQGLKVEPPGNLWFETDIFPLMASTGKLFALHTTRWWSQTKTAALVFSSSCCIRIILFLALTSTFVLVLLPVCELFHSE